MSPALITSLPVSSMVLFPPDQNLSLWNGKEMHEALALRVRSLQPKQLSLFVKPLAVLDQRIEDHDQPSAENVGGLVDITSQLHDLFQSLNVTLTQSKDEPLFHGLHVEHPQTTPSKYDAEPNCLGDVSASHIPDARRTSEFPSIVTGKTQASKCVTAQIQSWAPPEAKALPPALDWLFNPEKAKTLSDRVMARLIQSEAHEVNPSLKSDYRQAFICVSLASKGNTEPFLASSYQMHGIHPSKVWPRIVANRKSRLGREYYDFFTSNDMPRPDVGIPPSKRAPVYDTPNDHIQALLNSAEGFTHARSSASNPAHKSVEYSADSTLASVGPSVEEADAETGAETPPSLPPQSAPAPFPKKGHIA